MKVKELKEAINAIKARDDEQEVIFRGRHITDFWWIDTSDGYVFGVDEEVEDDGFITREEDLMMSERTAKPVTECEYPKCDGCDKYVDGYCTVPMVVSKQIYRFTAERIAHLEKSVIDLEKLVMDEILGKDDAPQKTLTMYKNITWDEVDA